MKTKDYGIIGNIDYGTWKNGASIFKDNKGYYIAEWNHKTSKEYKKYIKNWKTFVDTKNVLYLNKTKGKWTSTKPNSLKNLKKIK